MDATLLLRDWSLPLDADMILRGQDADPATVRARRPRLLAIAKRALAEGLPLVEPVVALRRVRVAGVRHDRLLLEEGRLAGPLIAGHLAPATEVAVLVCTIGAQLEWLSSELLPEDAGLGLALDGLGAMAAEALGTAACKRIEDDASAAGLYCSIPLSPGMVGWPLEQGQPEIFALVDAAAAGVTLTSGYAMLPRKSLSMVVGLGPQPFSAGRTCDYCQMRETCRYQDHYT
jgi:hypothetical protein